MKIESFYLDYNATSPLSPSVSDWLKGGEVRFANPSGQHSSGKAARKIINESRSDLFSTFNKKESDTKLFFHSGATEAFFTLAYSFAESCRLKGLDLLICSSKTDHPCVSLLSERYFGPHLKFLELKKDKELSYLHSENYSAIKDKKDNNPNLVILYHHLWVHNETGLVAPLEELADFKNIPDLYIHVDAVQTVGKIPEWNKLTEGDIWTFSGHKFGAFKGIGFSFLRTEVPFHALFSGGGQQQGMRSGTENPQGVKSISLALKDIKKIDIARVSVLRSELERFMSQELKGIGEVLLQTRPNSNTIYFFLNNLTSDLALALFDLHGLEISAGSACSSGTAKASEILLHRGLTAVARNGLRLSFDLALSSEDLLKIKVQFKNVFDKLRSTHL